MELERNSSSTRRAMPACNSHNRMEEWLPKVHRTLWLESWRCLPLLLVVQRYTTMSPVWQRLVGSKRERTMDRNELIGGLKFYVNFGGFCLPPGLTQLLEEAVKEL